MTETLYSIKGCPGSIALLTDTHDADPAPILASLRAHAPALILHGGDFVHGRKPRPGAPMAESPNAIRLLEGCAALAPTYVSIGNHEAYLSHEDLARVRATGVTLLDNAYAPASVGPARLVIGGLSSGYYTACQRSMASAPDRRPTPGRRPAPETGWLEGYIAAEGYHILLTHHPEYFRLLPPGIELALSGHAHGGQWRFYDVRTKQWRGVYAPDQGLFPQLTGGMVDGRLVISRGLNNVTHIPRLHNDTEIVYFV